MIKKLLTYKSIIFILIIIGIGCSTEKNTRVGRAYHNLTSKYNVYFNGNESFRQGVKKVDKSFQDDYSKVLPVFKYGDKKIAKTVLPEMDMAIKKASKSIKLHSITAKPKRKKGKKSKQTKKQKKFYKKSEYCNWIDDSYLLMGKAHFYKHDFFQATETFEFIIKQYNKELIKYDGMLWLVRTFNELKKYNQSKEILELIEGDKNFPKKLTGELAIIYADYYMKQAKYEDAVPQLRIVTEKTKKKRLRARYKYILAQIYQNIGDDKKASSLYGEVIKMNPPYEMAFNAKINQACSFDLGAGSSKEIKKNLNKMLKDDKNIEYQDQIYYALANIAFKENLINTAIEYYKLSAKASVANTYQKAISYLAVADIYFDKPDYQLAQAYYDSSIVFLDTEYPDYEKIYAKTKNLTELVTNLNTVELEDSLQAVAQMSKKERNKLIDEIIEKLREEEERIREQQQQDQINSMLFQQDNLNRDNNTPGGKWYFYNPSAMSIGSSEFKRKWGSRKLEDDWRRKSKEIVNITPIDDEEYEEESDTVSQKSYSNKSREYYLKNLPFTDSLIKISDQSIVEALFNIGKIYKEKLSDYKQSIKIFEELNNRFPENEFLLLSYYNLYQLNKLIDNHTRAEYYKNLIVAKFPDSKYAKILTNPNYLKELEAEKNKATKFYLKTYSEYIARNYFNVIENCNYADSVYNENKLIPKFAFLKALSIGKTGDIQNFANALKDITVTYPDNEVKEPAQDILAYIKEHDFNIIVEEEQLEETEEIEEDTTYLEIYSLNENAIHFYVVVVENKKTNVNRLKFNISSYNIDFFSMYDFNVSAVLLNSDYQIITVKSMENKKQGMNYYESIIENQDVYKDFKKTDYRHFIISADNFTVFYNDKDISKYWKYFKKFYLN